MMRKYEVMFLLGENLAEPKAKEIAKELNQHITTLGGSVFEHVYWGKKRLAYKIGANAFGYYFISQFEAEPTLVAQLTHDLNLDERVIRYLISDFVAGEIPDADGKVAEEANGGQKAKKTDESEKKESKKKTSATKEELEEGEEESAEETGEDETSANKARQELAEKQDQAEKERRAAMEKMIEEITEE